MKKIGFQLLASIMMLMFAVQVSAQDKPAPSPLGKIYQRVGVTDVEITYSRPSVKERTIFAEDGLVPMEKLWRTGANAASTISFSTDVTIGGSKIPSGTYSILSIPGTKEWVIMLNSDAGLRGTNGYDENKNVATIKVEPMSFPMNVETMTFVIGDVTATTAMIGLIWEKTMVGFTVEVEKTWE